MLKIHKNGYHPIPASDDSGPAVWKTGILRMDKHDSPIHIRSDNDLNTFRAASPDRIHRPHRHKIILQSPKTRSFRFFHAFLREISIPIFSRSVFEPVISWIAKARSRGRQPSSGSVKIPKYTSVSPPIWLSSIPARRSIDSLIPLPLDQRFSNTKKSFIHSLSPVSDSCFADIHCIHLLNGSMKRQRVIS